jgi:hypothetical protein
LAGRASALRFCDFAEALRFPAVLQCGAQQILQILQILLILLPSD